METRVKVMLVDGTVILDIPFNEFIPGQPVKSVSLLDVQGYLKNHHKIQSIYGIGERDEDASWSIVKKTTKGKWRRVNKLHQASLDDFSEGIFIANKKLTKRQKTTGETELLDSSTVSMSSMALMNNLSSYEDKFLTLSEHNSHCAGVADAGGATSELCSISFDFLELSTNVRIILNIANVPHDYIIPIDTHILALRRIVENHFKYVTASNLQYYQIISGYQRKLHDNCKLVDFLSFDGKILVSENIENDNDMYKYWVKRFEPLNSVSLVMSLISRMQHGFFLSKLDMENIANMFFSKDPLFCAAIEHQKWIVGSKEEDEERDNWIHLNDCPHPIFEFNDSTCGYLYQHVEYVKRIKIGNISPNKLMVEVIIFPSRGDFLGYKQSCKILGPFQECRISIHLVPFLPPLTVGIVFLVCHNICEQYDKRIQYYVLGYRSTVKVNMERSYWQIGLGELLEDHTRLLGIGASAVVHEANIFSQSLASKVFKEHKDLNEMNTFVKEVEHLCDPKLRHPNIVAFYGASDRCPFRIITEKLECTLASILCPKTVGVAAKFHRQLSWTKLINIATDILSAMIHLHASGFLHRDLKSTNIMITSNMRAKIADLGSTVRLGPNKTIRGVVGTIPWMAPEVYEGEYGIPADIYSFGVTLFEIASKMSIFYQCMGVDNFKMKKEMRRWYATISDEPQKLIGDIVLNCCHKAPSKRCSSLDILVSLQQASQLTYLDTPSIASNGYN